MITIILQNKAKIGLLLIALAAAWCFWLWQPERQIQLHQRHLLDAAQTRNWPQIEALLDDDFRTSAGHNKTTALQQLAEVLRPFFSLQINDSSTEITQDGETGRVHTILRIDGKGMTLAEAIMAEVNESKAPFEFTWKRGSWKPWDWRLVKAENPLISLAAGQLSSF